MREIIKMDCDSFGSLEQECSTEDCQINSGVAPFFSIRKLRLIYNELHTLSDFEYHSFDDFERQVMSSAVPQLELNKWQAISSRR